jgi:large subunit ribosomal protein L10
MKTKAQKQEDVKKAEELLQKSQVLVFADFGRVSSENMRRLRRAMKDAGTSFAVVKKRLLNVAFKEKGIDYDARQFDAAVGTIFSPEPIDKIGGPVYKFFAGLGTDQKGKEENLKKLLGAYDIKGKQAVSRETLLMIGQLPPREVLLSQVLGTIAAPLQALLYILQQKSEQSVESK